jgi:hypothetical protein
MSKPSFYDKLTEEEKKEYDAKIKSVSAKEKESYVAKNIKLWKKFLQGDARLTDFPRLSRSATSEYQYFFTRNGKTCFQYKSFVKDLLEAIASVESLSPQRKSMMKYELVKFLQPQKFSRAGERGGAGVEVKPSPAEELNAVARAKEAEKKAQRIADNLNKSAIQQELNIAAKEKKEEDSERCPYADGTPQANRWHMNRP